jgi:D-glycero-D-manno-heptose 1,7-bisphosphate phosphatase
MKRKALFLDRDGVINIDKNYIYRKKDFDFIEGIFDLIINAKKLCYSVIIVTNQSGIGRGFFTEEQFLETNKWMTKELLKHDAKVDHTYFCPTHPTEGIGKYKIKDDRRKPNPGMFFEAEKDHNIDLLNSILIGDKLTDMKAGRAAGIKKLFLFNNHNDYHGVIKINKLGEAINYL